LLRINDLVRKGGQIDEYTSANGSYAYESIEETEKKLFQIQNWQKRMEILKQKGGVK